MDFLLSHMCRNWFPTYEKRVNNNVLIGNDTPYKIVGIKFTEITCRMVYWGYCLTLVKFKTRTNLISMDALDIKSFTYMLKVVW